MKLPALVGATLLLVTGSITAYGTWSLSNSSRAEDRSQLLTSCVADPLTPGTYLYQAAPDHSAGEQLARIACAKTLLGEPRSIEEVTTALQTVFELSRTRPETSYLCHDLTHEIGLWAFAALAEQALVTGYGDCGFGYYHGTMQFAITQDQIETKVETLRQFCVRAAETAGPNRELEFYSYWASCSHGVGHSAGTAGVDPQQAARTCARMAQPELNSVPHEEQMEKRDPLTIPPEVECYTGYLNEIMGARERTGQSPTAMEDVLQECGQQEYPWGPRCVAYSIFYSNLPLKDVIATCQRQDLDYSITDGCWEGVGYRGNRILYNSAANIGLTPAQDANRQYEADLLSGLTLERAAQEPKEVARYFERVCKEDQHAYCLTRVVLMTAQHLQNPQLMLAVCAELRNQTKKALCDDSIRRTSALQGG